MFLRQLKYFVSVVRLNSFTEAAEECFISQSAISQQIQALEGDLGVDLLIRKNRSFQLTPAGEYLYRHAGALLEAANRLRRETIGMQQSSQKKLRIGYLSGYVGQMLQKTVADFSQQYPDVDIEMVSGTHEELHHLLIEGEADLLFSDQRRAFSEECNNFKVFESFRHVELSAKDALSERKSLEFEDLGDRPCILVAPRRQLEAESRYLRGYLNFRGEIRLAGNLEEARMLVVAGKGFLLIDGEEDLPQMGPAIRRIPLYKQGKRQKSAYYAFWMKYHTEEYLADFARQLRENFNG